MSLFKNSVTDPDPGSGAFLTLGSGMGKKNKNPDPVKIFKFFDEEADPEDPRIF